MLLNTITATLRWSRNNVVFDVPYYPSYPCW